MADPAQQGTQTVPAPPTGDPSVDIQGTGDGGKLDRLRGLISRLSGGGTPAIDAALKAHHDRSVAEAGMYKDSWQRAAGIMTRANATKSAEHPLGINPVTRQPATDQDWQTWKAQHDAAQAGYAKIAGKSKEGKALIQQMGSLLGHLTGHQPQGKGTGAAGGAQAPAAAGSPKQQAPASGGRPSTVQPPPQAAATSSQTVPPPPGIDGAATDALVKQQDALRDYQAKSDIDSRARIAEKESAAHDASQAKMDEEAAKAKAESAARIAEFESRHKAKMEEIDEAAKVKAQHATATRRAAVSAEDKFQQALAKSDYVAAQKEVKKVQADYEGAVDRQKTMHQNLDAGLKGDQQAMLSLVANHIGMTLGAQKGARITRAVWDEATSSAPWLAKVGAKFSSDGYLSGVTLTPEQMRQMVDLGDQKVDILKEHVDRVKQAYSDELAVRKGRGKTVSAPPSSSKSIDDQIMEALHGQSGKR